MRQEQGQRLYNFIHEHHLVRCLELGFHHGVSSAYIAGAIQDMGEGELITIDLESARLLQPNITSVIDSCGLQEFVTYYYEHTSYNWRLMHFLESDGVHPFDFCYIDGGHTWHSTGFAFCLVAQLLKQGGWIVFDDLDWTHEDPTVANMPYTRAMSDEERRTRQIRKVYELLVLRDARFDSCFVEGPWAFARKRS
jgi:predicted O-methyltransferase YrrM